MYAFGFLRVQTWLCTKDGTRVHFRSGARIGWKGPAAAGRGRAPLPPPSPSVPLVVRVTSHVSLHACQPARSPAPARPPRAPPSSPTIPGGGRAPAAAAAGAAGRGTRGRSGARPRRRAAPGRSSSSKTGEAPPSRRRRRRRRPRPGGAGGAPAADPASAAPPPVAAATSRPDYDSRRAPRGPSPPPIGPCARAGLAGSGGGGARRKRRQEEAGRRSSSSSKRAAYLAGRAQRSRTPGGPASPRPAPMSQPSQSQPGSGDAAAAAAASSSSSSSSSRGPTQGSSSQSSASSSSGTTLSSLETLPTQEMLPPISEGEEEEEEEQEGGPGRGGPAQPWGCLLALASPFPDCDCVKNEYWFGRDPSCDYSFAKLGLAETELYKQYSKKHFRIFREQVFEGCYVACIEDTSANGTFVNSQRVGKGRKLRLEQRAKIALSLPHNKVFEFYDLMVDDHQLKYPKELRDKYVISKTLGSGACGEVKLALERATLEKVAVKIINKRRFMAKDLPEQDKPFNIETEVEILKKINHPCLIKIIDFFEGEDFYIVLELMRGGELFDRVLPPAELAEATCKLYFYQMLLAVQYLHNSGIIHRDLKLENVLLSSHEEECLIKITDFGQSKILGETSLMKTLCGTPDYLAPEVQDSAQTLGYRRSVDCWSLGVILFMCLVGHPPFAKNARLSLREQIARGEYYYCKERWNRVSKEAFDLVKRLLTVDPDKRLKIEAALEHPWLQDESMKSTFQQLIAPTQDSLPTPGAQTRPPSTSRKRHLEEEDLPGPSKLLKREEKEEEEEEEEKKQQP
ncbi:serine/threonine-protein kinase Chk2 isoform X2 [Hemicordylus capensis]|uniref:serine/threonine-protein kinase Chk2 isoform X2 n=1 Tax=Hemicordylus capensis TaxID=884348 RepID=UPI0023048A36|nr:serine/threonine-protein kinase Chk2 isoform X2 [Hemicordylus capensis]